MDNMIYRTFTAIVFCSAFVVFAILLRHKKEFVAKYGVNFLLMALTLGIMRLLIPYEPPFSLIIPSHDILPAVQKFAQTECFILWGHSIIVFYIAMFVWLVGSGIQLGRIAFQIYHTKQCIKSLYPMEYPLAEEVLRQIVLSTKPKQNYRLLVTDEINIPMISGYFHPTIILPLLDASAEELHYILLHEWNHFLKKDLWKKLLLRVIVACSWWNPLIYFARINIDYALEVECDKRVIKALTPKQRIDYVQVITDIMHSVCLQNITKNCMMAGLVERNNEPDVQSRCDLILTPPKKMGRRMFCTLNLLLVGGMLLSYVFVIQPRVVPPDSEYEYMASGNSYLLLTEDNQYELYLNGDYMGVYSEATIDADIWASIDKIIE